MLEIACVTILAVVVIPSACASIAVIQLINGRLSRASVSRVEKNTLTNGESVVAY